jgi:hypothetical protein
MSMGWDCLRPAASNGPIIHPPDGSLYEYGGRRWNDIGRAEPTKNLSQCHFVHHKSHIDWARIQNSAVRGRGLTACAHITNQKCKNLWIIISTISNEWRCLQQMQPAFAFARRENNELILLGFSKEECWYKPYQEMWTSREETDRISTGCLPRHGCRYSDLACLSVLERLLICYV